MFSSRNAVMNNATMMLIIHTYKVTRVSLAVFQTGLAIVKEPDVNKPVSVIVLSIFMCNCGNRVRLKK